MDSIGTEELFRRHAPFVARFVTRVGGDPQDLEDVVQEVFMTAHRRGGYIAGAASPTTWLASIVLGVLSSKRRSRRRRPEDASADAGVNAVAPGATPAEAAETKQAYQRVQNAIEQLAPERRAVFVLFELEEQSCERIAAGLGIPIGTVHSRLHKARKEFSEALERMQVAERGLPAAVQLVRGA